MGRRWMRCRICARLEQRPVKTVQVPTAAAAVELGSYRHYMQKEIFEQPPRVPTRWKASPASRPALTPDAVRQPAPARVFKDIDRVLILACGTSYYTRLHGQVLARRPGRHPLTQVEVASEYRYRTAVPNPQTLVVTITQTGETADTLAALRHAKSLGMTHTLTICNVATSAMVRECDAALHHPRRRGDRRGLNQGLHHPAGRRCSC